MQDNTAAVDEEEPPSSANKLLNHWLRFSSVVVVSKTFTTAETMLNARTLREWINFIFSWVSAVPTLLQVYEQVVSV
ncbi:unnamed protein product [Prunus armeniaca]